MVDGKCPDHDEARLLEEKNYFFKMSKYQDWLIGHIENTQTSSARSGIKTR